MSKEKTTETSERAKPDKSKEAKFQRALEALSATATAYFADGDTATAIEIRNKHDDLAKILDAAKE